MKIKPGVSIAGVRPETVLGMMVVASVYDKFDIELVLTSVIEGKHKSYSLHYIGHAMDTRTRDIPVDRLSEVTEALKDALSDEFDVVLEGNHYHIEFQPIKGVNQ